MLTKGIKELCKFAMHLMTMRSDDSEKVENKNAEESPAKGKVAQ
jgi:hypothetical protein